MVYFLCGMVYERAIPTRLHPACNGNNPHLHLATFSEDSIDQIGRKTEGGSSPRHPPDLYMEVGIQSKTNYLTKTKGLVQSRSFIRAGLGYSWSLNATEWGRMSIYRCARGATMSMPTR